jgi:hypothetical protein
VGFVVDTLSYAHSAHKAVEVILLDGDQFLASVHKLDEDEGVVVFYDPALDQSGSYREIPLDAIASVSLMEIDSP